MHIFNDQELELAEFLIKNNNIESLEDIYSSRIQDLAISWSYYSGKIEGNTYSFVETEILIKTGFSSEKKFDDAVMLKNLYNTFISEVAYIKQGNQEVINQAFVKQIHSQLTKDLIHDGERGVFRTKSVRITGTNYVPPTDVFQIQDKFADIMHLQEQIENPFEKAVYLHCNLARLQPFVDGNKRTSRMIESICLMNENIIPIYSVDIKDIKAYREALLAFYETENYTLYTEYLLSKKLQMLQEMKPNLFEELSFKRKR